MRIFKECHVNEKDERIYRQNEEGKGLVSVKQENTSRLIPSFILMLRLRFGEYWIVSGIECFLMIWFEFIIFRLHEKMLIFKKSWILTAYSKPIFRHMTLIINYSRRFHWRLFWRNGTLGKGPENIILPSSLYNLFLLHDRR